MGQIDSGIQGQSKMFRQMPNGEFVEVKMFIPESDAWTRHDEQAVLLRRKYGLEEGKLGWQE